MPKPEPARGEPRLAGRLLDGGRDGVPVVLDEEADREVPGRRRGSSSPASSRCWWRRRRSRSPTPRRSPACRCDHAKPAACGTPPPTMALVPMAPASFHCRCIDPPRPCDHPRSRPAISASVRSSTSRTSSLGGASGSRPLGSTWCSALARNWWWPRCDPLTESSLVNASTDPTAPPSWPMLECAGTVDQPGTREVEHVLLERPDPHELGVDRAQQGGVGGVPVGIRGDDLHPGGGRLERAVVGHLASFASSNAEPRKKKKKKSGAWRARRRVPPNREVSPASSPAGRLLRAPWPPDWPDQPCTARGVRWPKPLAACPGNEPRNRRACDPLPSSCLRQPGWRRRCSLAPTPARLVAAAG